MGTSLRRITFTDDGVMVKGQQHDPNELNDTTTDELEESVHTQNTWLKRRDNIREQIKPE